MGKISATFYILTFFGSLLVLTFAKNADNSSAAGSTISTTGSVTLFNGTSADAGNTSPVISSTINSTNSSTNSSSTPKPPERDINKDELTSTPGVPIPEPTPESNTTTGTESEDGNTPGPVNETTMKSNTTRGTTGTTRVPYRTTKKDKYTTTSTTTASTGSKTHGNKSNKSAYVIVLLIIIFGALVIGIIFFCARRNRRRFSIDVHSKNEDAHIPLAIVEPEVCESSPKDMKTFTPVEESTSADTVQKTEEEKAPTEADQQVNESPAATQTTEAPAEKPAEPKAADVNDGDPSASNKTSVETLNDTINENNSNNNAVPDASVCFIDICLND